MIYPIVDSIESSEIALRTWLQVLSGGMTVIQPGDNPDVKSRRLMFQLIDIDFAGRVIQTHDRLVDTIEHAAVSTYRLQYQVDALYSTDSANVLTRVLTQFQSGQYRRVAQYENFAYTSTTGISRINEWRRTRRHYRATATLDFAYKEKIVTDANAIDTLTLVPCQDTSELLAVNPTVYSNEA